MDILVADDAEEIRHVLANMLKQLGHKVVTATNGEDALSILESSSINIVISDWMMPQMSGLELCKILRKRNLGRYIYFIMLTALSSKDQIVEGMEAGADDYILKPFLKHDLKARINAGVRILELEKQLAEQNNDLRETNERLQASLSLIEEELKFTASLQKEILPKAHTRMGDYKFEYLFLPCRYAAGDIFSFYKIDENHLLFFQLDVAGHGAASAMLSFSLSRFISGLFETCSTAKKLLPDGNPVIQEYFHHPANILNLLNNQFIKPDDATQYFTICLGIIHLHSNEVHLCRAGHPFPVIIKNDGTTELVDQQGHAVGMLSEAHYTEKIFKLEQGEKLFIYSDGLLEAIDHNGQTESNAVLHDILQKNTMLLPTELLDQLKNTIDLSMGNNALKDDISVLIIERK